MNRIILLGRLTKDPDVRYTPSGRVVTEFTLAVDRPYKNQDGEKEVDFIPVNIWGKQAETLGNSVVKGARLLVEGRLQIRTYEAKDGTKRFVAEVVADRFEYIERKSVGAPQQNAATGATEAQGGHLESFGTVVPPNEEIPF